MISIEFGVFYDVGDGFQSARSVIGSDTIQRLTQKRRQFDGNEVGTIIRYSPSD
ncbi:hypothetical protein Htur_4203 (plasmid) [Haloterrigena turkmenica DSM 5511]|uniref:Uncharacterized protein n=1 Tax=Haloterrigena turkmenica (strain ATCC 51198 / DSM 5511 / JCM 9101 / NCIMB 13204 / VKM B-1734 / 4k) TaxID=543526 RepID=D2S0X7_HALTV|nr:hypothetical protein Htur_4203 [Haloterrigena turkmenica DSM 5511]